jgi:alpha-tubulin suppressor-like RCC1 family protein/pimeloyl-ACP methyl ester carboxylesterase
MLQRDKSVSLFAAWLKAILTIIFVIGLIGVPLTSEAAAPTYPATYPVIFIHGLNSSSATWDDFRNHLVNDQHWIFGGNLKLLNGTVIGAVNPYSYTVNISAGDFYTLDFSSSTELTFEQQGWELAKMIAAVKTANKAAKVVLVGHSMGGLAARAYLQGFAVGQLGGKVPYGLDVARLITVGTPHSGSSWPYLCQGNTYNNNYICNKAGGAFSMAMEMLKVDSPGFYGIYGYSGLNTNLTNPTHGLPPINYTSIVVLTNLTPGIGQGGDGIVTDISQNLNSLPLPLSITSNGLHKQITLTLSPTIFQCLTHNVESHTCETDLPEVQDNIEAELLGIPLTFRPHINSTLPTSLTSSGTTLNAKVDPFGSDTSVWFEFATNPTQFDVVNGAFKSPVQTILASNNWIDINQPSTGLASNTTYYFRAVAQHVGAGTPIIKGAVIAFTTPSMGTSVLPAPTLTAPAQYALNQTTTPILSWSSVTGASSYRIMVSSDPSALPADPASAVCVGCAVNTTSITPGYVPTAGLLNPGTTYYWQVKGRSTAEFGYWSTQGQFTTAPAATTALPAPIITYPINGTSIATTTPSLSWGAVTGASSYRIMVAKNAADLPIDSWSLTCPLCVVNDVAYSTSYSPLGGQLVPGNTYSWQVKARSPSQFGLFSGVQSFTVTPQSCTYSLSLASTYPNIFTAAGGQSTVTLLSQSGCAVSVTGGAGGWATLASSPTADTSGRAALILTVSPNTTAVSRSTTFNINGQTLNVTQNGSAPSVSYSITVSTTVGGNVTPSGTASYGANQQVTLTATPQSSAYQFGGWLENGVTVSNNSIYTFNATQNRTLTAQFVAGTLLQDTVLNGADAYARWRIYPGPDSWLQSSQSVSVAPNQNYTIWCSDTPYYAPALSQQTWGLGVNYAGPFTCNYNAKAGGGALVLPIKSQPRIAVNGYNYLASLVDNRAVMWGWPNAGSPGNGQAMNSSTSNILTPQIVPGISTASSVATISFGYGKLAAKQIGGGWMTWGFGKAAASVEASLLDVAFIKNNLAVKNDGSLWSISQNATLTPIGGITNVVDVAGDATDQFALRSDGAVVGVVSSGASTLGIDFDNIGVSVAPRNIPAVLPSINRVVSIASSGSVFYAVKQDGTVWVWGSNCCTTGVSSGYAGAVRPAGTYRPVQVPGITNAVAVYTNNGQSVYVVLSDGQVMAWGANDVGQLGRGTATTEEFTPMAIPGLSGVVEIAGGAATGAVLALKGDGTVWSWGGSLVSSPGNGLNVAAQLTPAQVICPNGYTGLLNLNDATTCTPITTSTLAINKAASATTFTVKVNGNPIATPYTAQIPVGGDTSLEAEYPPGTEMGSWKTVDAAYFSRIISLPSSINQNVQLLGGPCDFWLSANRTGQASSPVITTTALGENALLDVTVSNHPTCHWKFSTADTWVHVAGGEGYGAGQFTLQIDPNPTNIVRSATFRIGDSVAGAVYTVTQAAALAPDPFSFTPVTGAAISSVVQSNAITVTGLTTPATISISGGTYSIGCTTSFTAIVGTISNGQNVCVQQTSSPFSGATTTAFLTIGSASGSFSVTTQAVPVASLSTGSLVFGIQTVGSTSAAQSVKLTNTGSAALNITSISASANFGATNTCGISLATGASCLIDVTFSPTTTGTLTGTVTIISNAASSPNIINLTGGNTPPVPAGVTAHTISTSQIDITWTASAGNVAVANYKVYRNGVLIGSPTATSFSDTGLTAGAAYSYSVAACDAAGNCSAQSAPVLSNTLSVPDTQTPTVPTGLAATALNSSSISLHWNASTDNVAVSGYQLYRDGVLVGSPVGLVYVDNGLKAATSYRYTVSACDASGNCSPQSTAITATTLTGSLAAGEYHSVAIKSDGSLWSWGWNLFGQLGDNTTVSSHQPNPIAAGYVSVATGGRYSVALKADGSLWAWGSNAFGQLGDNTTTDRLLPKQIGTGYTAVTAGNGHTMALKSDGSLWVWGWNSTGQLGDSTTVDAHAPKQIDTGYIAIAAGSSHSLGLKSDGSLWAWGYNLYGQLGDNSTVDSLVPKQIDTGYTTIAAGQLHTVALKADGSLWAWGYNFNGQLGDNTTTESHVPKLIGTGYTAIGAGSSHTIALKSDGSLWAWGLNAKGQLGDNSIIDSLVPKQVDAGYDAIAAGYNHNLATKPDGSLWAWGANYYGELGDNTTTESHVPKKIGTTSVPAGDLTGNGVIDVQDALLGLRIAAGLSTATPANLLLADVAPLVNGKPQPDGKIDIGDVVVLLRRALGLVTW